MDQRAHTTPGGDVYPRVFASVSNVVRTCEPARASREHTHPVYAEREQAAARPRFPIPAGYPTRSAVVTEPRCAAIGFIGAILPK